MTKLKQILTGAAVGLALTTSSAALARDRDHDGRPDNSWAEHHDHDGYRDSHHDRSWYRRHHRARIGRDVVFRNVRAHGYRYVGEPYWVGDQYVIRAYDRHGRLVFVRVDPYSGGWIGFSFRL